MTRRSLLLPIYRTGTNVVRPLLPALALLGWRRRGGEDRDRVRERMGLAGLTRPEGRLVWVHAASTADGRALLPLAERLGARGFNVMLSTRTLASARVLKGLLPAGAFHQFMPIDVPAYVGRFLDHWRPDMVLLAGAELWPNVLLEVGHRQVPTIFVNARMSDRVYGVCRRLRGFSAALMQRIDLCLARGDIDAERFADLGAVSVQTVGDLAFDQPLPGADPMAVSAFAARVGARPVWVAALVEPDEAPVVLEAHRRLLPSYPDLLTVLVPSRPAEGTRIVEAAARQNFAVALRSRDGLPAKLPSLFVGDVAEEIGIFYRTSDIAFIGRSMTAGGRSPIEAAKLSCAVLHGPSTADFDELYGALDAAKAGAAVKDAAALARVLALLFEDGAKLRLMQRNAAQTMDRLCGGTGRVMRAIEPHVVQLLVEH